MPHSIPFWFRRCLVIASALSLATGLAAKPVKFAISAQSAADALIAFSKAAGVEVLFSYDDLKPVRTNALEGTFEPADAINRLLQDTGFSATLQTAGRFVVARTSDRTTSTAAADPVLAAGQSPAGEGGNGTVTGLVTNEATGDVLAGARIQVAGTPISITTRPDGTYSIALPAGMHTLVADYAGLNQSVISVTIVPGRTVAQDVKLTSDTYRLEPVTVSGLREATAQALQTERDSPNLIEVASTTNYGVPGANPGELLERLPEISFYIVGSEVRTIFIRGMDPSYALLMADGNRMASANVGASRVFNIEQYGTGNLSQVQVIMSAVPDMDADAIAGYINMVSARAYDSIDQGLTLTLGDVWRDRQDSGAFYQLNPTSYGGITDILGVQYIKSFSIFGGTNNLGIAANFFQHRTSTTEEDDSDMIYTGAPSAFLAPGVGGNNTGGPLLTDLGEGDNEVKRFTTNIGVNVDYKINANSFFSLRTAYNKADNLQPIYDMYTTTAANISSFEPGSNPNYEMTLPTISTMSSRSVTETYYTKNWNINPELHYSLFNNTGTLDAQTMVSYANEWIPSYWILTASDPGIGWVLNRAGQGPFTPTFAQYSGPSIYSPNSYLPTTLFHGNYWAPDILYQYRLDYRQDLETPVPAYIQIGGKYLNEYRYQIEDSTTKSLYTGPTNQGIVPWLGDDYRVGGLYGPYPLPQIPGMLAPNDISQANVFTETPANGFNNVNGSLGARVNFREQITSQYIEGGATIGKLSILGGLRVEETKSTGVAMDKVVTTANSVDPGVSNGAAVSTLTPAQNAALAASQFVGTTTAVGQYRNVFPSLNFTYEPLSGLLVRGAYSETIARPPIANLVATVTQNPVTNTLSVGNPSLKPYLSQNFDFSVQKYFEPLGEFATGVFLKQIGNYFQTVNSVVPAGSNNGFNGQYAGYTLSESLNTGNARVRGVYFNYQQQFRFLPGFLAGFGVYANWTFLETQGNYGTTLFVEKLANFTPSSGNYGLSYIAHGLQARLMANYRGQFLYSGTPGLTSAYYQLARTLLDFKMQYTFNRTFDGFFDVQNITNEVTNAFTYFNVPYGARKQGISFDAGVRVRVK